METPEEIKRHLCIGDYRKVAELTGISKDYVIKLMDRPRAKKHKAVLDAAKLVAQANISLGL